MATTITIIITMIPIIVTIIETQIRHITKLNIIVRVFALSLSLILFIESSQWDDDHDPTKVLSCHKA